MNTDSTDSIELCTPNTDTLLEMTPMQQSMVDSIMRTVKNNTSSWRNEIDLYIKQIDLNNNL